MQTYCPSGRCDCPLIFLYHWIIRILKQKAEALSDVNRHYFREKHPEIEMTDEQLIRYYADPESGGAKNFAEQEALHAFNPDI